MRRSVVLGCADCQVRARVGVEVPGRECGTEVRAGLCDAARGPLGELPRVAAGDPRRRPVEHVHRPYVRGRPGVLPGRPDGEIGPVVLVEVTRGERRSEAVTGLRRSVGRVLPKLKRRAGSEAPGRAVEDGDVPNVRDGAAILVGGAHGEIGEAVAVVIRRREGLTKVVAELGIPAPCALAQLPRAGAYESARASIEDIDGARPRVLARGAHG